MKIKKILYTFLLLSFIINSQVFALTHTQLLDKIVLNNPTLINSIKDIDLAKLDLKDSKAAYQPTIEFEASSTYISGPFFNTLLQEDIMDGPYYNFSLEITQPLFTWNKINSSVAIYDKILTIKNIERSSTFKRLESELETREASIYYLKQMKLNLIEQNDIIKKLVKIVNEAWLNDLVLEIDVLEIQLAEKQIELGIKDIEKQEKNQLSQLRKLINTDTLELDEIEYKVDEEKINNFLKTNLSEVRSKAISASNYNIQILTLLKDVKGNESKIANNDIYWKPDLALQIDSTYAGQKFPFIEDGYKTNNRGDVNLTVAIKSTIWDGGKKLNNIKRTLVNEEKANIDLIDAKNQITQALDENIYKIEYETSNIEFLELKAKMLNQKVYNYRSQFESGYGSEEQVLKTQLEIKEVELKILQSKVERAISYFTIMNLSNY